ncbi:MAG: 3-dehydroquinate dehydratase [Ignavibacteriae bacterium]|nr:3-dehydroquinate dehydratase [Ignavibacteriota bacterium]NOG96557.1 3-dehydroquinate dehydratase [Ignavibacteriota bacterium]
MKILVLNGPNLNMLGARDKDHYGKVTLADIENMLKEEFSSDYFEFFQSNSEGELIDKIQNSPNYFDGILINPGGYAHTSVAIKDALNLVNLPKIEVHLSNLSTREDYRKNLLTASECDGYVSGLKELGYSAGVFLLKKLHKVK